MSTGARRATARDGNNTTSESSTRDGHGTEHKRGRSLAQWFCLIAGLGLLLGGILGMTADNNFDSTATDPNGVLQGDGFLGFEVNGWHNLVHILSGAVLLLGFARHGLARTLAIAFGVVYAVLLVLGLVNGNDILGFVPVNVADNILHGVLALLGLGAGLLSTKERDTDASSHSQGARTERVEHGTRSETVRASGSERQTRDRVVAPADGDEVSEREVTRPGDSRAGGDQRG